MAEQSLTLEFPSREQPRAERTKVWMLALGMLTYGTFYTGRQNFGVAAASLRQDLHFSAIQVGTISASMLISYALGGLTSGYIADRFSARTIVCTGALLSVLLNWVTSFATDYRQALIPWALNGFVQAAGWAPCSRMVMSWWPQVQRGFAFGMMLFAAGSAALAAYVLSLASLDLGGWRYVFRLPALTMLPAILIFYVFAKQRQAERRFDDKNKKAEHSHDLKTIWNHYLPLVRNWRFLLLCGSIGCESAARYGLLVWVPVYMLGSDWHATHAGTWLMLLLPLGMAIGAASTGVISDRVFSRNRVWPIVLLMLLGVFMTGALYETHRFGIILSCLLLLLAGFAVYGPQAAYWAVATEIGGTERRGAAIGMLDSCAYIFAAAGETCIGWIVDKTGSTAAIFPALACVCLLSACFAVPSLNRTEAAA